MNDDCSPSSDGKLQKKDKRRHDDGDDFNYNDPFAYEIDDDIHGYIKKNTLDQKPPQRIL